MSAVIDHGRREVIRRAGELEPGFAAACDGPGRFERCADRVLAAAMVTLIGHGLQDDYDWEPSTDTSWDRIERWLVATSEDGFVIIEEFADAADAEAGLTRLCAADSEVAV